MEQDVANYQDIQSLKDELRTRTQALWVVVCLFFLLLIAAIVLVCVANKTLANQAPTDLDNDCPEVRG
jgi:uncharacterized SAM-binding protein YcdF (DUF218 family)